MRYDFTRASRESARPVAFEQSRIVIRIGRRISPERIPIRKPRYEARTRRTMAVESQPRARPSQTSKSAYAYANKSGFVDWSGERVRCPNLQRAHAGYFAFDFPVSSAASRSFNSVSGGRSIHPRIARARFRGRPQNFLGEISDHLTYLRIMFRNSRLLYAIFNFRRFYHARI